MSPSKDPNRLLPFDPENAAGKTKQLFDEMQAKFGMVPNLFQVLGNASAAVEAYVNFSSALSGGTLDTTIQEQNIFMNYLDHVARTVVDFPQGCAGRRIDKSNKKDPYYAECSIWLITFQSG